MGILSSLFRRSEARAAAPIISPTTDSPVPSDFLPYSGYPMFGGGYSDTGVSVTPETAMTLSAVWAAVRVISDALAGLPLHVQHPTSGERQVDNPLYHILHDQPNEFMTSHTFRTAMMVNALLYGNGYAYIDRDVTGRAVALLPLSSRSVRPLRLNGELVYQAFVFGRQYTLPQDRVFHLIGLTFDGVNGLNPIDYARQTGGISIALERFAARYFGQGCAVSGVIEPPAMSEKALKEFASAIRASYEGLGNSHKLIFVPPGGKFTAATNSPQSSQAIEQREHQIREIARIFGVPPHKMADLARATFSNIEHQQLEFLQGTISPWATRFEQEAHRKLLLEVERGRIEIRFNLDALLRADTKSRYDAHASALNAGWLTVNEVRAVEGRPPVAGGDILRTPLNMGAAAPTSGTPTDPNPNPTQE